MPRQFGRVEAESPAKRRPRSSVAWLNLGQKLRARALVATKNPNMHEVTVWELSFSTPRISMHRWRPSTTTPTPRGVTTVLIASAISRVIRS